MYSVQEYLGEEGATSFYFVRMVETNSNTNRVSEEIIIIVNKS